jgi:hypothetical protein
VSDFPFSNLPAGLVPAAHRERFHKAAKLANALGREDPQTGRIFVDETALRRLLQQGAPRHFETSVFEALRRADDHAIVDGAQSEAARLRPISWQALSEYCVTRLPAHLPSEELGDDPTGHAIVAAIQRHTDAPDSFFAPAVLRGKLAATMTGFDVDRLLVDDAETAEISRSLWDCLVGKLGFWGALVAVVLVMAAIIALTAAIAASGGTIGVAFWTAFWPIFGKVAGGGTVVSTVIVIVECLLGR